MAHLARLFGSCVLVCCTASFAFAQASHPIVISQVYGGGGNSGATYTHDYVELFNHGTTAVDVTGWSVQYASATGSSWQKTDLTGVIQPGRYYLVREAQGAGGSTPLPTPEAQGAIPMSATAGKVALVRNGTPLTCGATPCFPNANIEDFVGFGGANAFEGGGAAPTLSNATAALRASNGCSDTDNNGADFSSGSPTPRNGASPAFTCGGDPPDPTCTADTTIAAVQGSGQASPVTNSIVSIEGIVTGRVTTGSARGYFLQMPDAGDGDPQTSDGLFVFTGSSTPPAAAAVGNLVCVKGSVAEFVPASDPGTLPLTELVGPSLLTIRETGRTLPAPIVLTAADTPTDIVGALERFEGMRVKVERLTTIAPTMGTVDEAAATGGNNGVFYGVIEGVARPFREPGADTQDLLPAGAPATVTRFDGNPERLRIDSDAIDAPPLAVTSGATVTNLVGPLTWAFRTYSLFLDPAETATVSGLTSAVPVQAPGVAEFTIASFNVQRLYDTVDDPGGDVVTTPAGLERRLKKLSLAIRTVMRSPDIIGVEEAENLGVLQIVAARLNTDTVAAGGSEPGYQAYLAEGNDPGGIDVGFLVKSARVSVTDVVQEGKDTTYINPADGLPALLNDRPPLVLRGTVTTPNGTVALTVVANHLRSLTSLNDPADGPRVRAKRRAQAEYLANLVQARQIANPAERIVLVGDFNAFPFNDGFVDVMGTIAGQPTPPEQVVLASDDLVSRDLLDVMGLVPPAQRYSYLFDGHAQVIDHILINAPIAGLFARIAVTRGNADSPETFRGDDTRPERVTDHDSPVAYFMLPPTDVTARTARVSSPLTYNAVTNTYDGTVQVTNSSGTTINGPVQVVLTGLMPGMTLDNATGTLFFGLPYITLTGSPLAPGQSATVGVSFRNSGSTPITFAVRVFSGVF